MKKRGLLLVVLAVFLSFSSISFAVPLPDGTILTFDLGNAVQTVPCTTGSCFNMEVSPGFFLYTNIESCLGITLGVLQPGGGTHPGPPTGIEPCGVDKAWSFFGNTGMHQIIGIPVTDNGDGTLDFRGWSVTWNGIPDIPMGGDPANFPADTGRASITIDGNNNFTLDYSAHVPIGSPSGFGGVPYGLRLEGTIIHGDPFCLMNPDFCDDGDFCTADICIDHPDGTYSCINEPLVCPDDGNPCTDDRCEPATGTCIALPTTGNPCSDNDECTMNDTCQNGVCTGEPVPPAIECCGFGECTTCVECPCGVVYVMPCCTPLPPNPEVCDGLDNDCNGLADDGISAEPINCVCGDVVVVGERVCLNGRWVDTCIGPTPEVCDGIDNDCDGLIDEGFLLPVPTTCGVGECASTGELVCLNGTMVDTCVPGTPSDEVCDGLDNDCDGLIDGSVCDGNCEASRVIRGGGQRPTTVDLQIQTKFTVMNGGCIVDSTASTITVTDGTVLGFNCKVGNGPDPCYGELNGVPLIVDSIGLIVCEPSVTGTDTYKLVLHNKCNGGKDTDRMTIKIAK